MTKQLERIDSSTPAEEMAVALQRDGAAIVPNALSAQHLASINRELDDAIAGTAPGLRNPTDDFYVEFYGKRTIRIDGLPSKRLEPVAIGDGDYKVDAHLHRPLSRRGSGVVAVVSRSLSRQA